MVSGQLCGTLPDVTADGEWFEVKCNLKGNEIQLVTVQNTFLSISGIQAYAEKDASLVTFNQELVSQSSPYGDNAYPAANAVDGSDKFTHTNQGVGMWWKAQFAEEYNFTKIRIRNRVDCCGARLAKTKVMVSGQLCGTLPDVTADGEWFEVKCNLIGNEILLVTVQNTSLSISGIQAYACGPKKESVPVEAKKPNNVVTKTCDKSGVFGFPGKCYGGNTAKKWLLGLKMPSVAGNDMLQDVWDYITPIIKKINVLPVAPSGCMGDFKTNTLLTDPDSAHCKCKNFPLPEGEKMSAIGFSIKNIPCGIPDPKATKVEICAIFDKCGTFGISMSGGTAECALHATAAPSAGISELLVPIAKMTTFAQFGYSPNRLWTAKLQFLDPTNNMKRKDITVRSHVYMGAGFKTPELGIKFGKEDITKTFDFKATGKAFIDFGNKNDMNPTAMKNLIHDKSLTAAQKTQRFLQTAREFTQSIRGSLHLKLSKMTKNMIPDLKIADELDYNVLINLGKGADGDRGSSGMPAGIHIFMKPPPMDLIGGFIRSIVKNIGKVIKCGGMPLPKLPNINNVEMGFTLGAKIGFKIKIASFEYSCMIKIEGGLALSCKIGLGFLSIFKNQFKWIAKQGKALFDAAGKVYAEFAASPLGNFAAEIGEGAIKFMGNLVKGAKVLYDNAKVKLQEAKKKVEAAGKKIGAAAEKCKKAILKIGEKSKEFFKNCDKLIGDLKNLLGKVWKKIYRSPKTKRNDRRKKRDREAKKVEQERLKAERQVADANEITNANNIRDAEIAQENKELSDAQKEEQDAQDDENNKNSAYEAAIQRQKDLDLD